MRATVSMSWIGAAALALGCSTSTSPAGKGVSLSFTGAAAVAPAASLALDIGAGADNLVIATAEMVLRKIELERIEVKDCEAEPSPSGCEDFELGPARVVIPTGAGATTRVTINVEPGTYKEVQFEIHKVSGSDPADAAFRAANPDLLDQSIKVTGTFNGRPFTFFSDVGAKQEVQLEPNLAVTDLTTSTNLTIRVVVGDWFKTAAGALIDPATANKGGANENVVKENIRRSMKAFEDKDKDGREG